MSALILVKGSFGMLLINDKYLCVNSVLSYRKSTGLFLVKIVRCVSEIRSTEWHKMIGNVQMRVLSSNLRSLFIKVFFEYVSCFTFKRGAAQFMNGLIITIKQLLKIINYGGA